MKQCEKRDSIETKKRGGTKQENCMKQRVDFLIKEENITN